MVYIDKLKLDEEQWLCVRREGLGGSDAGAVMGVNPWVTPVDVYLDKTGQSEPKVVTDAMEAGNRLEPVVVDWWQDITGWPARRSNRIHVHPDLSFIRGNLDRVIKADTGGPGPGVLEVKTTNSRMLEACGREGVDYPPHWFAQVQHYLLVTGYRWGAVAVLVDGRHIESYTVNRDENYIQVLFDAETRFWRDHVELRVPPPPTCLADLSRIYPKSAARQVQSTADIDTLVRSMASLKARIRELQDDRDSLELVVKAYLGEADTLVDGEGNVLATWRTAKDSSVFDVEKFREAHPDLFEEFLTTRPGTRRFNLK